MGKDLVNELFKFIKSDESVSFQKLKEATDSAYSNVGSESDGMLKEHDVLVSELGLHSRMPKADEGKLPKDPSVATPDQVQTLAEEKGEKKSDKAAIKTAGAGVTADPEKSRLQKDMDKATPDVDKKSDFKVAAKVEKATKKEPEITGVSNEGDKELKKQPKNEGTLPKDPSVATPDQIQTLAEERAYVTVSDRKVADGISQKFPGSRVVEDAAKKQWIVMVQDGTVAEKVAVKEEKTTEPAGAAIKAGEVPGVKDEKDSKLTNVSKSDPKEPSIKAAKANVGKYDKDPKVGSKGASTAKQSAPSDQKIDAGSPKVDKGQDAPNVADSQKTTEPAKPAVKDTNSVAGTSAKKEDKLTAESKVQEDAEVTVTADGQTATIAMTGDGVNVSTSGASSEPIVDAPVDGGDVAMTDEPEIEVAEDPEMEDVEADEMAERIFVSDYLSGLEEAKLTEKQKVFIAEVKAKKMSKKNAEKVDKKVKALKAKKCC